MKRSTAPVFVVGSPRSGTTLLYHLLLSSGGFAVYRAEANVFNLLEPRFGDLSNPRRRAALLNAWLPSEFFRRSGLDPVAFRQKVDERCRNGGDLLRLLMEGIAEQQHATRWAECTPENLLYIATIKRTIPEAIFLHIVRDGRDVALSLARQGWIGASLPRDDSRLLLSGLYWEWMVRRGRARLRRYAADMLEVRFEALVEKPVETLARIASFLDHDLDYNRIRQRAIGTVGQPNTSFPDQDRAGGFTPVGRWKHGFDMKGLARFESATGALLEELGYPLHSDRLERRRASRQAQAARRLAHGYFTSRFWLKTRTPLGRVFTNPALLTDFHAFDRDRLMPPRRHGRS